jgi:stage V sporulation protein S
MQLLQRGGVFPSGVEYLSMTAIASPTPPSATTPHPHHGAEMLKVSSKSNPNSVAGAMAGVVREAGIVEVQVVGAGALNQAIKALAIARGYVAAAGIDLVCVPNFADIEIDGERRTAMRLVIGDRHGARIAPMATPIAPLHVARPVADPEFDDVE